MVAVYPTYAGALLLQRWELVSFIIGIGAHIALFRHGEWDMSAIPLCYSYIALFFATLLWSFYAALRGDHPSFFSFVIAGLWACYIALAHLLGVFGSMSLYRLYFHRLSSFPGPLLAQLSGFYMFQLTRKRWHRFEEVQRLHKRYGDFVRVAPQSLSITHPEATHAIYATNTVCSKGPFYNMSLPRETIFMTRNKAFHTKHRKDWDRAFSASSIREYETQVTEIARKLVDVIEVHVGDAFDVTKWFNFFSFDVMGELAFGKSFERLDAGEENSYMQVLHKRMDLLGLLGFSVPWLMQLVAKIPSSPRQKFAIYSRGLVEERRNMRMGRRDIFSWLLDAYEREPVKTQQMNDTLHGDCDLIVVAGSDTTASALLTLFYFLTKHPDQAEKLRAELGSLSEGWPDLGAKALTNLPHLNAVINESMRLFPPSASGVQRYTPPQGLQIGNRWIPGHVNVQVPLYTMCRDARYWVSPDDFIPERWTSKPELVLDSSIFVPFQMGKYACVGKQLALMEVREVTAMLVERYNFCFAPAETGDRFLNGQVDAFATTYRQPLELVFSRRSHIAN